MHPAMKHADSACCLTAPPLQVALLHGSDLLSSTCCQLRKNEALEGEEEEEGKHSRAEALRRWVGPCPVSPTPTL